MPGHPQIDETSPIGSINLQKDKLERLSPYLPRRDWQPEAPTALGSANARKSVQEECC